MRWSFVNDHLRLGGIPPEAHRYEVSGRTPLEWLMDRYRVTTDRRSGIVNDPNEWFVTQRTEDLLPSTRPIVYLGVRTMQIVDGLPDPFAKRNPD